MILKIFILLSLFFTILIHSAPAYSTESLQDISSSGDSSSYVNSDEKKTWSGLYWSPLRSAGAGIYFSDKEGAFIEGESGLSFNKGFNLLLTQDGYLTYSDSMFLYYSFMQRVTEEETAFDAHRVFIKLQYHSFSLMAGINNINLGPGEYGLLVSDNTRPYPMIKLQTENDIDFFGSWNFLIMQGWLIEEREDVSNPRLLAIRMTWKPVSFFRFGLTRTTLFGGDGRPAYGLFDYPKLILGRYENIPGDDFDNDAFAAYDLTFDLPLERIIPSVKSAEFYYHVACTDIYAFWQKEDGLKWGWPIQFFERAFQIGFLITTASNIFRIEYAVTAKSFYSHHHYPVEGYTYGGSSLGYPYGRNVQSILFKHRYTYSDQLSLEYAAGVYRGPCFVLEDKSKRTHFEILKYSAGSEIAEQTRVAHFTLKFNYSGNRWQTSAYARAEISYDYYDTEPLPTLYSLEKGDRFNTITGISANYFFN